MGDVRCTVLNQVLHSPTHLLATPEMHTFKRKRCSERSVYSACAIMADQLDTSKAWSFQEFDLRFYEQIESHFRHKEAWSRTHRIADRCPFRGSCPFRPIFPMSYFCSGIEAMLGGRFRTDWGDDGTLWLGEAWRRTCTPQSSARCLFSSIRGPPFFKKSFCTNIRKPGFRLLFYKKHFFRTGLTFLIPNVSLTLS